MAAQAGIECGQNADQARELAGESAKVALNDAEEEGDDRDDVHDVEGVAHDHTVRGLGRRLLVEELAGMCRPRGIQSQLQGSLEVFPRHTAARFLTVDDTQ